MKQEAISERHKNKSGCGRLFLVIWGISFFAAGVFFIWITAVLPFINARAAAAWPSANCRVLSSSVESHTDNEGDTTYAPKIEFEFRVDGKSFVGDRHSFSTMSSSSDWAKTIVDQYPPGIETLCYYDPQDPGRSVLNRDFDTSLLWMSLFPLIFVVIGAVAIAASVFGWGFGNKNASDQALSAGIVADGANSRQDSHQLKQSTFTLEADLKDEQWSVPMKLTTKQSRWISFLIMCGISVFWNGIVGVFVAALIFNTPGIWFKLGFMLFLSPFVFIGIVLLVGCCYMFLKLFTPRVEVALSTGAVPLGGDVDIAWEVIGRTSRLRNLKLEIQGEQKAVYRRGTDTHTDTEIFEIIPVCAVTRQDDIRFGSASVRIPQSTMHTHEGTSNQITWSVIVHGEIRWWPDVFESFSFRVKPVSADPT